MLLIGKTTAGTGLVVVVTVLVGSVAVVGKVVDVATVAAVLVVVVVVVVLPAARQWAGERSPATAAIRRSLRGRRSAEQPVGRSVLA
jgi:hypothetical protein